MYVCVCVCACVRVCMYVCMYLRMDGYDCLFACVCLSPSVFYYLSIYNTYNVAYLFHKFLVYGKEIFCVQ